MSAISEPRVDVGQGEESFGVDHGAIGLSEGPSELGLGLGILQVVAIEGRDEVWYTFT